MLQQTQVATVLPYFERFITAFPTVANLAAADEQQVLRLWQGLGYYRRARHLHAAAKIIIERYGGQVPSAVADLLELPGVGRYTAGAVASIAYGVRAPILDGNVARVLSRWFELETPADSAPGRKRLWELADEVVDDARPGDFNQAMMELGALVCVPRDPKCLLCPVAGQCGARRSNRERQLPVATPRKPRQPVAHVIFALRKKDGRYLFERRPERGLWSNMWQLVTTEAAVEDAAAWVRERYGLRITRPQAAGSFVHVTTHRDITFDIIGCTVSGGRLKRRASDCVEWRRLTDLEDLPLPNPQRRAVDMLGSVGDI